MLQKVVILGVFCYRLPLEVFNGDVHLAGEQAPLPPDRGKNPLRDIRRAKGF